MNQQSQSGGETKNACLADFNEYFMYQTISENTLSAISGLISGKK